MLEILTQILQNLEALLRKNYYEIAFIKMPSSL